MPLHSSLTTQSSFCTVYYFFNAAENTTHSMRSTQICRECLRAAREPVRAQSSLKRSSLPSTQTRLFSTHPQRWQQQQQNPHEQPIPREPPPPPPTDATTGTPSTPNIKTSATPTPEPTTAQMQASIRASLSHSPTMLKIAQTLRRVSKSTTETYVVYGYAEQFFKSCAAQAPYTIPENLRTQVVTGRGPPKTAQGEDIGIPDESSSANLGSVFWHDKLGLLPTFSSWSQVTYLHFYILLVHFRTMEDYSALQMHQRYLIEHFSQNAEDKMVLLHTIDARGIRNRYLKDLFMQWRGCIAAYDEGLVKGDAVLGAAVWRNLFKGEEGVDWEKVAVVVAYMRRCINILGGYQDLNEMRDALDGPEGVWARAKEGLLEEVERPAEGVSEAA